MDTFINSLLLKVHSSSYTLKLKIVSTICSKAEIFRKMFFLFHTKISMDWLRISIIRKLYTSSDGKQREFNVNKGISENRIETGSLNLESGFTEARRETGKML